MKRKDRHRSTAGGKKALHTVIAAVFFILHLTYISVVCTAEEGGINLTAEELAFIDMHPVIRLGIDPGFVPFEFFDEDGNYKGISADFVALISEKTGLKFVTVHDPTRTWPEVYDLALAGEIDVLPAVGKTQEREEYFLFTDPYYYFKRVIVTRGDETGISGIEDLFGMTVAVQRNSSHHSYLLEFPNINISLYETAEAALAAVATGGEGAFIGNLATSNYLIRAHGISGLRLVSFEAEKHHALYFAVRKDWPELVSIIDKVLDTISESEMLEISDRWVELDADINYAPYIKNLIAVGVIVGIIIALTFFWIARLRREVRRRKQIQLDLEQAKRDADEANEIKSRFLARMSHEIRTPLNAIMGMAYLLRKTEISLTQRMYVDRIIQASNNMLNIINDILDYAKIEAGKVELEVTSFSLDQVIGDVVNIVSYKIDEQGIGFRLSKDPKVPNWFMGDPKHIEQILLNILSNAVKFTSEGEVSLDIYLIAKENDRYHISFTVKDTGIGMSEEQVKKLFTPFEQGDSSINRHYGGSGLGLSIVKYLVDLMGGEIKVFSTLGEGSTFIINLTLAVDREQESIYAKALSRKHLGNIRILILEKSGANINLIESYLSSFGMYCELTSSEESAMALLEAADSRFAKTFDLFIIDFDTPTDGGFSFIKKLRNNEKVVKIPKIIMLFPMMRYDLFDKLSEQGVDLGIGKPIIPSILLNGILDIFNLKAVGDTKLTGGLAPAKLEGQYHTLLAEDNKTNQLIAKTLLEQVGITVTVASDGKEAVELYSANKGEIDLILMDLHMPVLNGYEAAEQIREISPDVPIVAMTADVILGIQEKCARSGIHYYISKPFDPDKFVETVKRVILKSVSKREGSSLVLDRALGLSHMGGRENLYNKVLAAYYTENRDTVDRLKAAIAGRRYEEAVQIVHKIKSSSGSIGAQPLCDVAAALQRALENENEDEIAKYYDEFSELLLKLLWELENTAETQK